MIHPFELTVCPDKDCGALAEIIDKFVLDLGNGLNLHTITHCVMGHQYTVTDK